MFLFICHFVKSAQVQSHSSSGKQLPSIFSEIFINAIPLQNPPSVPALLVVWLVARLKRSYFVIDWHNYGFSILALSLGKTHSFVKIYRALEFGFGRYSDFDFCVSESMKNDLKRHINKEYVVFILITF